MESILRDIFRTASNSQQPDNGVKNSNESNAIELDSACRWSANTSSEKTQFTTLPEDVQIYILYFLLATPTSLANASFTCKSMRKLFCMIGFETDKTKIEKTVNSTSNWFPIFTNKDKAFAEMTIEEKFEHYDQLRTDQFRTCDKKGVSGLTELKYGDFSKDDFSHTIYRISHGQISIAKYLEERAAAVEYYKDVLGNSGARQERHLNNCSDLLAQNGIMNRRTQIYLAAMGNTAIAFDPMLIAFKDNFLDNSNALMESVYWLWVEKLIIDGVVTTKAQLNNLEDFFVESETRNPGSFFAVMEDKWFQKHVFSDPQKTTKFLELDFDRKYEFRNAFIRDLVDRGEIKIEKILDAPCLQNEPELNFLRRFQLMDWRLPNKPTSIFIHTLVQAAISAKALSVEQCSQLTAEEAEILLYALTKLENLSTSHGLTETEKLERWKCAVKAHYTLLPIYINNGYNQSKKMLDDPWFINFFANHADLVQVYIALPKNIRGRFNNSWLQQALDIKKIELDQMCTPCAHKDGDLLQGRIFQELIDAQKTTVSDVLEKSIDELYSLAKTTIGAMLEKTELRIVKQDVHQQTD